MIAFTVIGKPEPAGSKRAFPHPSGRIMVVDANKKTKPWQSAVAHSGAEAMHGREPFNGPLSVQMVFYQTRPRGHYGSGRNSRALRPGAPLYPAGRPDVLKLARGAEDALTGVCWIDDARIVEEHLYKRYGSPPRVEVEIGPVGTRVEAAA
jgi:Holliday junction resolvase RusA-like endonuclease